MFSKIAIAVVLIVCSAACGGQQSPILLGPPVPNDPPPASGTVITAAQVFSVSMIGQTWTFQNGYGDLTFIHIESAQTCEFGICDGKSVVWHFTKNNARAYWNPGVADADLFFILHLDSDGAWRCIGFKWLSDGVMRTAAITLLTGWTGKPYTIIPASSNSSAVNTAYQSVWKFGYTDAPIPMPGDGNWISVWTTYAFTQITSTPFTGTVNALMSKQCEGGHSGACDGVWENWHLCPGVGLCAVEPIANFDSAGNRVALDPKLTMVRIN